MADEKSPNEDGKGHRRMETKAELAFRGAFTIQNSRDKCIARMCVRMRERERKRERDCFGFVSLCTVYHGFGYRLSLAGACPVDELTAQQAPGFSSHLSNGITSTSGVGFFAWSLGKELCKASTRPTKVCLQPPTEDF